MQVTQCPKCNGTFIINKDEIQADISDYRLCYLSTDDSSYAESDDCYDELCNLSDYKFYLECKDRGTVYTILDFVAAINDSDIYINDQYVARLIHKDIIDNKGIRKIKGKEKESNKISGYVNTGNLFEASSTTTASTTYK